MFGKKITLFSFFHIGNRTTDRKVITGYGQSAVSRSARPLWGHCKPLRCHRRRRRSTSQNSRPKWIGAHMTSNRWHTFLRIIIITNSAGTPGINIITISSNNKENSSCCTLVKEEEEVLLVNVPLRISMRSSLRHVQANNNITGPLSVASPKTRSPTGPSSVASPKTRSPPKNIPKT